MGYPVALTPLAAGYADVALTAAQIAPGTVGCKVTKGSAGLWNILVEQPVDITQVIFSCSPANVGPATGVIMAWTASQVAGQLQIAVQAFRRDTGANVDTSFSFSVAQLQKNF